MFPAYLIILLYTSFYTLLLVGIVILFRMIQKKMVNLLGLVIFFILYALQTNPTDFLPDYFTTIFAYFSLFSLAFFIKFTFYQRRKSAFSLVIALLTILRVIEFIFKFIFNFQPGFSYPSNPVEIPYFFIYILVVASQSLLVMVWYSYSVFKSYNNFRRLRIGVWLKIRYLMLGISTIIFSIDTLFSILLVINDFSIILFLIYASIFDVLLFTVVNFIAWVIPFKPLIQYIKGETKETLEDINEAEIIEKVKSELSEDKQGGNS